MLSGGLACCRRGITLRRIVHNLFVGFMTVHTSALRHTHHCAQRSTGILLTMHHFAPQGALCLCLLVVSFSTQHADAACQQQITCLLRHTRRALVHTLMHQSFHHMRQMCPHRACASNRKWVAALLWFAAEETWTTFTRCWERLLAHDESDLVCS